MTLIKDLGARSILHVFLFYLTANILYVLNFDGVYWDDWVSYNQSQDTLAIFYGEIMNTTHGYFSRAFHELGNGIYAFRVVFVIIFFISGLMIIAILKTTKFFDGHLAYMIGLMYMLIPTFHVKVALSIIPFYVPVFIFFWAWYLLAKHIESMTMNKRLLILTLFFISFTTNSLLVVYAWALFFIFYKQQLEHENKRPMVQRFVIFMRKNWDFILVPIIFFGFKLIVLKPNGLYDGYNSLKAETLSMMLAKYNVVFEIINVFSAATLLQVEYAVAVAWPFSLLASAMVVGGLLWSKWLSDSILLLPTVKKTGIILAVGVIGVFLAVFPYLAVGKLPVVYGWNSRFLALSMLPASLVIYALVVLALKLFLAVFSVDSKHRYHMPIIVASFAFLLFTFVGKGLHDQHRLNMDWFYQVAIQQQFKESAIIHNNSTFVVDNKVRPSLAYQRHLVYYEWNGLLKKVFKDDSRLMIPPFYLSRLHKMGVNQHYRQYNFSTWVIAEPILVTIDYAERMTKKRIIQLYWYRLFDYPTFSALAKELVGLSYRRIEVQS